VDSRSDHVLLRWWARWAARRAAREPGRDPGSPSSTGASPADAHPLGSRLVGSLTPLLRLSTVAVGTVAVVLEPDGRAVVSTAGELLVPQLLTPPGTRLAQVLPISTEPVHLDVTLAGLVSFDGYPVGPVTLRLVLQLHAADGFAALADLVATHGVEVETLLLDPVPRACAAAAQGAVAMNRLAELQRLGLRQVLADRWLPAAFSGGLLVRRGFEVVEGHREEEEPTVSVAGRHPVSSPAGLP
jgi:hypothetical protein